MRRPLWVVGGTCYMAPGATIMNRSSCLAPGGQRDTGRPILLKAAPMGLYRFGEKCEINRFLHRAGI